VTTSDIVDSNHIYSHQPSTVTTMSSSGRTSFGRVLMFLIVLVTLFALSSYVALFRQVPQTTSLRAQVVELQRALSDQQSSLTQHFHQRHRAGHDVKDVKDVLPGGE
jgi:hypothetical protein